MDMPWGSPGSDSFVKNVGLITSNGPNGHDVMAAEWTYQISYSPGMIAISIGPGRATSENIIKSKEFGVSIASNDQNIASSIAGASSGRDVDKIAVMRDMGVELCKAKHIDALMVKGSVVNIECKLVKYEALGDHILFIGEVLDYSAAEDKKPLMYHSRRYWRIGDDIPRPNEETINRLKSSMEKRKK